MHVMSYVHNYTTQYDLFIACDQALNFSNVASVS